MSSGTVTHIDSDRLVELAQGVANASEAEAGHLAACAECTSELEIVSAASRLGRHQMPAFDAERIAAGVQRRLAAEPPVGSVRSVSRRVWWLGGLAAAAVALFAIRSVLPPPLTSDTGVGDVPVLVSVLHELDDLSEPQLEALLQSLPPAAGELDHVEMAPLSDLNAADLEQMLRSMEE